MQFLPQLVGTPIRSRVNLTGLVNRVKQLYMKQIEFCEIELIINENQLILYGVISPKQLAQLEKGVYFITEIQLGVIDNKYCGLLTQFTKIHRQNTDSIEFPQYIQNPFLINLHDFFNSEELSPQGILVGVLNSRLQNLKLQQYTGYVIMKKINTEQKILNITVLDDKRLSYIIVDLSFNAVEEERISKFNIGCKVILRKITKQNRVLINNYKGYMVDQEIIQNDELKLFDSKTLGDCYAILCQFDQLNYSTLDDIQQYTIDRLIRKFKIDLLKTNFIGFQFGCKNCGGAVKQCNHQQYTCQICFTKLQEDEFKWEFIALVLIKIQQGQCLLRLKDNVAFKFFDITGNQINQLHQFALQSGQFINLREQNQYSEQLPGLFEQCYKQAISKVVFAHPYCDFSKTAKIKERWKQINKMRSKERVLTEYEHNCYSDWIRRPNEYERLLINPNGSFEIQFDCKNSDNWYNERKIMPMFCLEGLAVREIDLNYFQYLKNRLK